MKRLLLIPVLFLAGCFSEAAISQGYQRHDKGQDWTGPEIRQPSQESTQKVTIKRGDQPSYRIVGHADGTTTIERID
jgi:hypothetical protein